MIADIAFHAADRKGDQRNVHAHVMLTMRGVGEDGFGTKERSWNNKALLEGWREQWAEIQNRTFARLGLELRVDHRSLEAQGLDRKPEPKQGRLATEIERDGRPSLAGDDRRAVKAENEMLAQKKREAEIIDLALSREERRERLAADPQGARIATALDALDADRQRGLRRAALVASALHARGSIATMERWIDGAAEHERRQTARFAQVFRDGGRAQTTFEDRVRAEGVEAAIASLRAEPARTGDLKGWSFLGYCSRERRTADGQVELLARQIGWTLDVNDRVARDTPALARARQRHEATQLRLRSMEMQARPSRQELLVDLAEAGRYLPDTVYRMLTPADQRLLVEARETRKTAQIPWRERAERVIARAGGSGGRAIPLDRGRDHGPSPAASASSHAARDRLAARAAAITARSSEKEIEPPSAARDVSKERDRGPGFG